MSEGGDSGAGGGGGGGGGGESSDSISNDQKLAHFQELTHLDDFEQCQAILESTNWDLDQAIQSYFTTQFSANEAVVGVGVGTNTSSTTTTNITTNRNNNEDEIIDVTVDSDSDIPSVVGAFLPMRPPQMPIEQEKLNSFFNNLSTHNFG